jgi:hypothetical protein
MASRRLHRKLPAQIVQFRMDNVPQFIRVIQQHH